MPELPINMVYIDFYDYIILLAVVLKIIDFFSGGGKIVDSSTRFKYRGPDQIVQPQKKNDGDVFV